MTRTPPTRVTWPTPARGRPPDSTRAAAPASTGADGQPGRRDQHQPTASLVLLAEHLSADELSHLAAVRRQASYRPRLRPEAAEELAELLTAGQTPALGWWRRHLPSPELHHGAPVVGAAVEMPAFVETVYAFRHELAGPERSRVVAGLLALANRSGLDQAHARAALAGALKEVA